MRPSARSSILLAALTGGMLVACQPSSPPAQEPAAPAAPQVTADTSQQPARSTDQPATDAPTVAPAISPAAFADKVWKVKSSGSVEPDTVYAFLGDGTLVIDSPNATPMHGKWSFESGKLTMVEEGIAYPTDILKLDANELHLRSHNPGQPVDIVLTAAPGEALPSAAPEK
ncbi:MULTISPECIES: hypothetical protein [unclassified Lysobacter]|uniref:hypothetical protein n=1 Tax=unclassified Lysobacter TaxID=2635362 RepID=UPI001C2300DE|nr:hypothetical protein [Lysobacter sp. MMG2]MBU8975785.1 hypothetical protein [Lysobacter sp. MMG2]